MVKQVKLGLVAGRHDMPVEEYVFENIFNPTDVDGLYKDAYSKLYKLFSGSYKTSIVTHLNDADAYSPRKYRGHVDLYVSGLTTALIAVINAANVLDIHLTLWHYDRDSEEYYPQEII